MDNIVNNGTSRHDIASTLQNILKKYLCEWNNEFKWEACKKGRWERVTQEGLQNYGNEPE